MEKKEFIVFWIIYLSIILISQWLMILININFWLIGLIIIIFGIIYWYVLFKYKEYLMK